MFSYSTDTIIYHYCSIDSFLSIIQNRCLWLTDSAYTNDLKEMHMMDEVFYSALEDLYRKKELDLGQIIKAKSLYEASRFSVFLGCFSIDGDLLGQWRDYADQGKGFAIGFSPAKMNFDKYPIHLNVDFTNRYFLEEVVYSNEAQLLRVSPIVKGWLQMHGLCQDAKAFTENAMEMVSDDIRFSTLRYCCKHDSFSSEKEIRAMWIPPLFKDEKGYMIEKNRKAYKKIKFRAAGNKFIPYTEMPFEIESVKQIILGPKNDMKDHIDTLKLFLHSAGYDDHKLEISISNSPYR